MIACLTYIPTYIIFRFSTPKEITFMHRNEKNPIFFPDFCFLIDKVYTVRKFPLYKEWQFSNIKRDSSQYFLHVNFKNFNSVLAYCEIFLNMSPFCPLSWEHQEFTVVQKCNNSIPYRFLQIRKSPFLSHLLNLERTFICGSTLLVPA